MKIGIIGGGLSGLAVAYNLRNSGHDVHVYEKRTAIGGDCHTVTVRIGDAVRWSDLGVNDFNTNTYRRVTAVMDELGAQYADLEDTACFYSPDDSIVYTLDGSNDTPMRPDLRAEFERFRAGAAEFVQNAHVYEGWTVEHYLKERGFSADLAEVCIYPRINAMYFCGNQGPGNMPVEAVMHYYVLQEGFGTGVPAHRRFFVGGTRQWIERLAGVTGATIHSGFGDVQVSAYPDHVTVHLPDRDVDHDRVAFACHAEHALKAFRAGLDDQVATVLRSFSYLDSTAVAHTWGGILSRRQNAWRTYNVLIRDPQGPPTPYSMTYVENRHQNDAMVPQYDHFGTPVWFVTLNPQREIPERDVLIDADTGEPAVYHFPHNVVDFAALNAQQHLPPLQGTNNVWFAGGWTLGAGLHEECWEASTRVAELILGKEPADTEHLYHLGPEGRRRAPTYLREAVGQD